MLIPALEFERLRRERGRIKLGRSGIDPIELIIEVDGEEVLEVEGIPAARSSEGPGEVGCNPLFG